MRIDAEKIKNILVIRPDMLGDVVLITPVLAALRKKFPAAKITVLAQPMTRCLLENNPNVDAVYEVPRRSFGNFFNFWKTVREIKSRKFDLAVNYFNSVNYAWLCLLAGIPLRLGDVSKVLFGWMYNLRAWLDWGNFSMHEVEQNLALLSPLGIKDRDLPLQVVVDSAARTTLQKKLPLLAGPKIVVHLGTGGSNKPYSIENLGIALKTLLNKLHVNVILIGTRRERASADQLMSVCGSALIDMVEKTTLPELVALIAQADVYIGVDSGPMHIAAALNRKVVALFTSKSQKPAKWGPWRCPQVVLHNQDACKLNCFVGKCKSDFCTRLIEPAAVAAAVENLLKDNGDFSWEACRREQFKKSWNILVLGRDEGKVSQLTAQLRQQGFCVFSLQAIPSLRQLLDFYGKSDITIVQQLAGLGGWDKFKVWLSQILSGLILPLPVHVFRADLLSPAANYDIISRLF
ncbi:MAG: glycosyltransferase family 9 protein [Candidatus Margulisiibacteriota bacterium]